MNQIYLFITNNSVLLAALLVAIIALFVAILGKKKQEIYANLPALISAAQALEIANEDKFKFVLDLVYGKLPAYFKIFIKEEDISYAIEFVLTRLKMFAVEQAKSASLK